VLSGSERVEEPADLPSGEEEHAQGTLAGGKRRVALEAARAKCIRVLEHVDPLDADVGVVLQDRVQRQTCRLAASSERRVEKGNRFHRWRRPGVSVVVERLVALSPAGQDHWVAADGSTRFLGAGAGPRV